MDRPLFQHIKNHDSLFTELGIFRNAYALSLGLTHHDYHKTPKFINADGKRLSIEPERSIVVPDYKVLCGVKTILERHVPGFKIVKHSDIGFRYPTAALAGSDAPFIKRFRSEFFHRNNEDRDICRPINLSYGIKSRGKGDNREEYEVWLPDDKLDQDPTPLLIDKYGEDLPEAVRDFSTQAPIVHGWMGVKRGSFEAIYQNKNVLGDIAINIGLSVDAFNIGARPDLSFAPEIGSSIAVENAELEWEVMGYYAPKGSEFDHDQIWHAINATIAAIGDPISDIYNKIAISTDESKTERILSTIRDQGVTARQIAELNLHPREFLITASEHRRKTHDPARSVNLLGRLNRLFYQEARRLPSLLEIHDLIAQPSPIPTMI